MHKKRKYKTFPAGMIAFEKGKKEKKERERERERERKGKK